MKITIESRFGGFHARLEASGIHHAVGCGRTVEEAIGDLIIFHQAVCGVELEIVSPRKKPDAALAQAAADWSTE